MKRTFIFNDGKSDKFWSIEINETGFTVNYGKTGTDGQTQTKDFSTTEECTKQAEKLIAEKTKKGYVEQGGTATQSATVTNTSTKSAAITSKLTKTAKIVVEKPKKFTLANFKEAAKIIESGDLAEIQRIIDTGIPLNEPKFKGTDTITALGVVAEAYFPKNHDSSDITEILNSLHTHDSEKKDEIAQLLIQNGANPMFNDALVWNILEARMYKTFECALEQGFDMNNSKSRWGSSFLSNFMYKLDILEYLLDKGADPSSEPDILHRVAMDGSLKLLKRLVEDYKLPLTTFDSHMGRTPLQAIREYCNHQVKRYLPEAIKNLEDPELKNRKNHNGRTPAEDIEFYESRYKNLEYLESIPEAEITTSKPSSPEEQAKLDLQLFEALKEADIKPNKIEQLLLMGANANAQDAEGKTPLHYAAACYYPHLIEKVSDILINAGTNPKQLDNMGRTPMFYFATGYNGSSGAAVHLKNIGIDVTVKDKNGDNALAYAINTLPQDKRHETAYSIMALIKAGVPMEDINNDGDSVLHHASRHNVGNYDIVGYAVKHGADINYLNKAGQAPLHVTVMRPTKRPISHDDYLKELIEQKADINIQDADGNTALHLSTDTDDYYDLIGGRVDLNIRNKAGQSVLENIMSRDFYKEDSSFANRIKKEIDMVLNAPSIDTPEWEKHAINENAQPPSSLSIVGSIVLSDNDADDEITYLGKNKIAISGNIPEAVHVVDTQKGEVIWKVNGCVGGDNHCIADDEMVYIGREYCGSRFMTAHNIETGEEIWKKGLSSSYKQFGTHMVLTAQHVIHANRSSEKLYCVDRFKGKKTTKIEMKNPCVSRKPFIPWANNVLMFGMNSKTNTMCLDIYSPLAGTCEGTLFEFPAGVNPLASKMINGFLYTLSTDGIMRKIKLPTGDVVLECNHDMPTDDINGFHFKDNKLYYILGSKLFVYDVNEDKLVQKLDISQMETPIDHYHCAANSHLIYHVGHGGGTGKDVKIYDAEKKEFIASLMLPNYGGYDWREGHIIEGDSIYLVQKGGREHNDGSVLHRIK